MLEAAGHHVATFGTAEEFLHAYDPLDSGCLLLDVMMPGMDGMELLRRLNHRRPAIPVIMLTGHGDIPMAVDAIQIGAFGFLEKPANPKALREKVAAALAKEAEQRCEREERDEILARFNQLTARERQVARLLIDGKRPKSIATALGTAHSTVRNQQASILKKMRADNVPDLAKMINMLGEEDE
jgi:FixJ family two-component response regulator